MNYPARRFARSPRSKVIAGVCGGIAEYVGLNPTLVRVLFVLSLLLPGPQVVAYILLWIFMPKGF